jgi:uncharacterized protein YciI
MAAAWAPASMPAGREDASLLEFIYLLRPVRVDMVVKGPTSEETRITAAHTAYLEKLSQAGTIVLYGRTRNNDESTFGIVIFRAPSEQEARRIMESDPAVSGGIMRASLYPYRVAYPRKE